MLLIVGGSKDHNIARLAQAAEWRKHPFRVIYTDRDPPPSVTWQPGFSDITIDGETFSAKGSSFFIRYDVFGSRPEGTTVAFYEALRGWAAAHPEVGMFNRGNENLDVNKPRALVLAKACGFDIPKTWITSDFNRFCDKDAYIAKPVAGGEFTRTLGAMEGEDRPYIVQEKLSYPELRLFRAGRHYFAFSVESSALDYRATADFSMREVEPPAHLVAAMERLTDRLGLDYAAADFKTNPESGQFEFLEINTMPMFTGYDDVAEGRLSDAMVLTLKELGATREGPVRKPGRKRAP